MIKILKTLHDMIEIITGKRPEEPDVETNEYGNDDWETPSSEED